MSLYIEAATVRAVLLADGWHDVARKTFDLDAYEFADGDLLLHGGGQSGVCATGFSLETEDGDRLAGPLTAILAVRQAAP